MSRTLLCMLLMLGAALPAAAADPEQGRKLFGQACAACHSLEPGKHMTGPSLAGLWSRKAGDLEGFSRYSSALKSADVEWSEATLDAWLADPEAFIPGNFMGFPGIDEAANRTDVIAFLKRASDPASEADPAAPMQGMMGMGGRVPNLSNATPDSQVKAISYCGDTYTLEMADGETVQFWERNLRFKTDGSESGPPEGSPAVVGAGMMGDRASVIFASPEELGRFIRPECPTPD